MRLERHPVCAVTRPGSVRPDTLMSVGCYRMLPAPTPEDQLLGIRARDTCDG